jgi:fucokinase
VPKGSGLGTSSILGAATIHALDRVFGRDRGLEPLVVATSALEQMLGTRGGWQDQIGGVIGGFKIGRTAPGMEQRPRIERLRVPALAAQALAARSLLYFTGERRMAKNILENVVWNWLVHEPAAVDSVRRLCGNAERMRAALVAGDVDAVVGEIDEYRECKRLIDPGSCPAVFGELAARWRRELSSWCLAGAGGGGFMLLVARDADAARSLSARIARESPHPRARAFAFEVDAVGLRCAVL